MTEPSEHRATNPPGGHRARRRFGQNFLQDPAVAARIVAAVAPRPGERIVEIGPGLGALTGPLLAAAGSLDVIEIDRDLAAGLHRRLGAGARLRVHCADALGFDLAALPGAGPLRVVGNLPYNISTPLLFHLMEQRAVLRDIHCMLQKEVVERIVAHPGAAAFGRLSVMLSPWCTAQHLFRVPAGAFRPRPAVDSAFLRLSLRESPLVPEAERRAYARVVGAAFNQRRKTLRNALAALLAETDIRAAGIDPSLRAENLSDTQFLRLARALDAQR